VPSHQKQLFSEPPNPHRQTLKWRELADRFSRGLSNHSAGFLGNAKHGADSTLQLSGYLLPAKPLRAQHGNTASVQGALWSSKALALRSCIPQAGLHAFGDHGNATLRST
jgi:hypothetical protein